MTSPLALLLIGLLLLAIGRKNQTEAAAPHLAGTGFVCLCLAIALFCMRANAAPPAEAEPEVYVVVKQATLERALTLMQLQAAEIQRLRDALKTASVPKECI